MAQATVSRAERGEEVAEVSLVLLERAYGMREAYPAAPKDPARRAEWFAARNARLRPAPPPSGIFGKGDSPKAA